MNSGEELQRFDPHMLRSFVGDSPDVTAELLELYASSCRATIGRMVEGAARGDARAVHEAAHRLKSSSLLVGALALSRLAESIERHTEEAVDPAQLVSLVDACRQETDAALQWIAGSADRP